jgi:hypothetical protein
MKRRLYSIVGGRSGVQCIENTNTFKLYTVYLLYVTLRCNPAASAELIS